MADYKKLAKEARKKILEMIHRAGTSHIASNLSLVDMAVVLYQKLEPQDEVVWSKGWAAALGYYMLAQKGDIPKEDLDKFPNEPYLGLMEPSVKGVHVAGGSVGHGLPVAVGMAFAKKRSGEKGKVYCIMSDGELNEGAVWESAMIAAQHHLDNLVAIIDKNGWQAMGKTSEVLDMRDLPLKWSAFGWWVTNIDGHNFKDMENALDTVIGPMCIIGKTVKGKGVSFMENHLTYHYKHVSDEDYEKALAELNA